MERAHCALGQLRVVGVGDSAHQARACMPPSSSMAGLLLEHTETPRNKSMCVLGSCKTSNAFRYDFLDEILIIVLLFRKNKLFNLVTSQSDMK